MKMSNKVYDYLKFATMILLPAIGVLYTTLAGVWNLPFANEIQATILAIVVFLGAVLELSSYKYAADNS